MKIYLAGTAPGNDNTRERGMLNIPNRLLSYYFITTKLMFNDLVFKAIKKANKK